MESIPMSSQPQGGPQSAPFVAGSFEAKRRAHESKIVRAYESPARRAFNPTETTRYLNIGYWKDGARTLDEACQAMAELVGTAGEFSPADHILDAGSGFGDQDIFWAERFNPRHITGIDINPAEVEAARRRVAERGLSERVDIRVASAVEMPFEGESFDKVVALEAAHHFMTREDFFREAFRVLRPGGRLVTADVIPLPGRKLQPFLNAQNSYPRDVYARKLSELGFKNVRVTSIREHVFRPYANFIKGRLRPTDLKGLFNVGVYRVLSSRLDYVLATADKLPQ